MFLERYRKSAEQGDARGQSFLGGCYERGQGVTQDYTQAVTWFRKAAEQGDAPTQNNLGYCYEKGNGVEKNMEQAAELYKKSARKGNKQAIGACKRLGISY